MSTSVSPSGQQKPRQRRFNPKVRTGCKTCRTRRVKCGEEKPSCQRCVSSGRVCDGYETIRMAQASTSSTGELTLKWVQPTAQPPDTSIEEQSAFHHFRVHVLESLAGPFDPYVWHKDVLSIAMTEPAVRNAVIALGALGRIDDQGKGDAFALKHYSMAMKALHDRIPIRGQGSAHLTLVTCLLFIAFEFQKDGYVEAKSHLDGGLMIIRELQDDPRSSSSKGLSTSLIEAFERLDIQMSIFTAGRVHLNRVVMDSCLAKMTNLMEFHTIEDAHRQLNVRMAAMRELVHTADEQRFSGDDDKMPDLEPLKSQLLQQLVSLSYWETAMTNLAARLTRPNENQAARILRTHHICCKLMVVTSLTDGREKLWDDYTEDFRQVLHYAECVQAQESPSHGDGGERESEKCRHSFRLDMGIIPPVYFTAMKCRNPTMRRQAIQILSRCDYQEGAWHGVTMANLARSVVSVEEEGLVAPQTELDVPEKNRLYRAWYDLAVSDKLLYCRRRCFEVDGRWIDYVEQLDRFAVPGAAVLPSQVSSSNSPPLGSVSC